MSYTPSLVSSALDSIKRRSCSRPIRTRCNVLQAWQLSLLNNILGVQCSAPNWTVLRACGQELEPLRFYCFRAVVKFYNSMVQKSKFNPFLKNIVRADVRVSARAAAANCWPAQLFLILMVFNLCKGSSRHTLSSF